MRTEIARIRCAQCVNDQPYGAKAFEVTPTGGTKETWHGRRKKRLYEYRCTRGHVFFSACPPREGGER